MGKSKYDLLLEEAAARPKCDAAKVFEAHGIKWQTRKNFAKADVELLAHIGSSEVNTPARLAVAFDMDIKSVRRRLQRMRKRGWIDNKVQGAFGEDRITEGGTAALAKRDESGNIAPGVGESDVDDDEYDTEPQDAPESLDNQVMHTFGEL